MIRQNRYTVLKNSDIQGALWHGNITDYDFQQLMHILDRVSRYRESRGKDDIECVVVEHDWPEYEPVWNMIQERVDGSGGNSQEGTGV